jgi:predicted double-glycine peptidase
MSHISRSNRSPAHASTGGLSRAHGHNKAEHKHAHKAGSKEDKLERLAEALQGNSGPGRSAQAPGHNKYKADKGDTLEDLAKLLKSMGFPGSVADILQQLKTLNPQLKDGAMKGGEPVRLPRPDDSSFTPSPSRPAGPDLGSPAPSAPSAPSAPAPSAPSAPAPAPSAPAPAPAPAPSSPVGGPAPIGDGQHVIGRDVPYINQLSPTGADGSYTNGAMNCGPTAMAMLARSMGIGAGMTDAQLINHLGEIGGTNSTEGTNVNGIVAMANAMGQNAQVNTGTDVSWMADQLRQGKQIVALGDFHAMPPHQDDARTSGHFVTVTGMDANGNFLVRDPADPNVRTVTPEQMAQFLGSHPAGGHTIAVG